MTLGALLASLRDICLFRRGPDDLPYTPRLLVALLVGCGVIQALMGVHEGAQGGVLAGAAVGGLAAIAMVWLLLRNHGKAERFVQTATALAATYLVFGVARWLLGQPLPLKAWREELLAQPPHLPEVVGVQAVLVFATAVIEIWQVLVWIGIVRRSLEVSLAGSVLVFLLLLMVNLVVAALVASAAGVA